MSRTDSKRFHRARLRAEGERRHVSRSQARERARAASRTRLKAAFIAKVAAEEGIKIELVRSPLGADVLVHAPCAPDLERCIACKVSFRNAVIRSLEEYLRLARRGGDGP
jgi:hypothetical protein